MWRRLQRWSLWVAAGLVGVLVVTGVWLWFRYQPDAGWFRYEAGDASSIEPGSAPVRWPQALHAVAGGVVGIVVLLATLAAWAARREARGRPVGLAATVAALGLAFGAAYSGYLIAWEQLAISSVTVGDVRGMGVLWDPDVRFVIVDGAEVAPATVQRWAVAHVLWGTALAAAVAFGIRGATPPRVLVDVRHEDRNGDPQERRGSGHG
jgi:quinol-cytochrome oxidoreductase complex cytochrome b subunit